MSLACPDCGKPMYQGTSDLWWCDAEGCKEAERAGEWAWCQLCQEVRPADEMQHPLSDWCCRECHITHYEEAALRCDPWLREELEDLQARRVRRPEMLR